VLKAGIWIGVSASVRQKQTARSVQFHWGRAAHPPIDSDQIGDLFSAVARPVDVRRRRAEDWNRSSIREWTVSASTWKLWRQPLAFKSPEHGAFKIFHAGKVQKAISPHSAVRNINSADLLTQRRETGASTASTSILIYGPGVSDNPERFGDHSRPNSGIGRPDRVRALFSYGPNVGRGIKRRQARLLSPRHWPKGKRSRDFRTGHAQISWKPGTCTSHGFTSASPRRSWLNFAKKKRSCTENFRLYDQGPARLVRMGFFLLAVFFSPPSAKYRKWGPTAQNSLGELGPPGKNRSPKRGIANQMRGYRLSQG